MPDILSVLADIVTLFGGPIAAVWALKLWRDAVGQGRESLRWQKQAKAFEFVDELFNDAEAYAILELLDGELKRLPDAFGGPVDVTLEASRVALQENDESSDSEVAEVARRCCDALFHRLRSIQEALDSGLITFGDIRTPLEYYVEKMLTESEHWEGYIRRYDYKKALDFLREFEGRAEKLDSDQEKEPFTSFLPRKPVNLRLTLGRFFTRNRS